MTTADALRRGSGQARFATEPAAFDLPCAIDEALLRLRGAVRRSALSRWSEPGLVGHATRDNVRVRWHGGRRLLPVVFDGHFSERNGVAVLEGHYRHARGTKLVCNFLLGFCVVLVVFGIMGMTLLWTVGQDAADKWLTTAILIALIGVGALALLKGRLPLRPAECDELGGAIRSALRSSPAR
jgi:hypothetical protein